MGWNQGGIELSKGWISGCSQLLKVGTVEKVKGVSILLAAVGALPLVVSGEVEALKMVIPGA